MPAVSVRHERATLEHTVALAPHMRAEDAAEVLASGGYTPLQALAVSLAYSEAAWATLFDGQVAAMWGVCPYEGEGATVGIPWLLTGHLVQRHPRAFLRASRTALAQLLARYPVLVQAIDARYAGALRWAAWLGGQVGPPGPFGVESLPFHRVTFRRHHHV